MRSSLNTSHFSSLAVSSSKEADQYTSLLYRFKQPRRARRYTYDDDSLAYNRENVDPTSIENGSFYVGYNAVAESACGHNLPASSSSSAEEQLLKSFDYLIQGDEITFWHIADSVVETTPYAVIGNACQTIMSEHYAKAPLMCSLALFLCGLDLDDVKPWGISILISLLFHKDERVKESAVTVLDNWGDVSMLPILMNIDFCPGWLADYVADVIFRLEQ